MGPQSSASLLALKLSPLAADLGLQKGLAPEDFQAFVKEKIGIDLTEQELVTLLRECSEEGSVAIDFSKLLDMMNAPPSPSPPRVRRVGMRRWNFRLQLGARSALFKSLSELSADQVGGQAVAPTAAAWLCVPLGAFVKGKADWEVPARKG